MEESRCPTAGASLSLKLEVRRLQEPDGRALLLYRVTMTSPDERDAAARTDGVGAGDVRGQAAPLTGPASGTRIGTRADG